MMTVHKLTAGHGYTYLTRQVAANDASPFIYAVQANRIERLRID
jgi:hypothetical protein